MWEDPKTEFTPMTKIGTPVIHPEKENVAFGRWALQVLAKQLVNGNVALQKRALASLSDQIYDPKKVSSYMFPWLIPILSKLGCHDDVDIRMLVAKCFSVLTMCPNGRMTFVGSGMHRLCMKLALDEYHVTRYHASQTLYHLSLVEVYGVRSLVNTGLTQTLLTRLKTESLKVQRNLLKVLHGCYSVFPQMAVEHSVLDLLLCLLKSPCPLVRESVCLIFVDLGATSKGQEQVLQSGAVPSLISSCLDDNADVRAKALSAVSAVSVLVPAKQRFVDEGAVVKILPLLEDDSVDVVLNCIKALTILGEEPRSKAFLKENVDKFLVHAFHGNKEVKIAAEKAAKFVTSIPSS